MITNRLIISGLRGGRFDGREEDEINSFAKMNGFHVNQVLQYGEESLEQLQAGNVDAMLGDGCRPEEQ